MPRSYYQTISNWPRYSLLTLALALATTGMCTAHKAASAETNGIQFDLPSLQARGIDPKLADLFSQAPRFLAGETTVSLTVNGSSRGKMPVRFDNEGNLCADRSFLKQAGLQLPPSYDDNSACFDLKIVWPQMELNLDPGESQVNLVVPPEAVAPIDNDNGNWHHGGLAGILNYDAQYLDSSGISTGVNYMQLYSEVGFNAGDWIVRSQQNFSRFNGEDSVQHQRAYAQRTFLESKKVLQAGQISLSNSMFGTGQVLGFQLFPESALQGTQGGPGIVEGIADSQSVIEVRQSGVLVYNTTVPAGPYRLQGFPLLNTRSDLSVKQTDASGETRQFIVPASALLLSGNAMSPGLSFGVGRLEQQGASDSPLLGTLSSGWVLTPYSTLNAGMLGSSSYHAGALGVDSQVAVSTILASQIRVARDARHGENGISALTTLSHKLTERVNVSANISEQSSGFRELSDTLSDNSQYTAERSRRQTGISMGWSVERVGNLSLSWARSETFGGDAIDYLRGGWSRQFGRAYVGISLEHDTGSRHTGGDNRLYATLSIPLGDGQHISSYFNNSHNISRTGARYSNRGSQDRGWSLSAERDLRNNRASGTGTFDLVTPVSQLSGNISRDSNNYTSWSARATGAMVVHREGATLSPYQVSDTFGVARVGKEGNVRLDTPSGPTWTDGRGYAVLPSINGFKRSTIQVDTRSLARNVDISNAWQETEAARGSISYVNFDVIRTRRVLVDVKDFQGTPLPHGASVFDSAGKFITVVGDKGSIFIPDVSNSGQFDVQTSGRTLCSFHLVLPEQAASGELFEMADAVCR